MGHVYGNRLPALPQARKLNDEVIAAGGAEPHHVLPATGWVSCWMAGPDDADGVIDLFRIQYDRYRQGTAASHPVEVFHDKDDRGPRRRGPRIRRRMRARPARVRPSDRGAG